MNTDEPASPNSREQTIPDPSVKIHWAPADLAREIDALKARNWISEDLIRFSQKHWRCSREQAVERLLVGDAHSV